MAITLTGALENTSAYFVIGLLPLNAPFYGGTLVPDPNPPGLFIVLPTGPVGAIDLGAPWPLGVPGGVTLLFQYWVVDPGAAFGFAGSNAISALTP